MRMHEDPPIALWEDETARSHRLIDEFVRLRERGMSREDAAVWLRPRLSRLTAEQRQTLRTLVERRMAGPYDQESEIQL